MALGIDYRNRVLEVLLSDAVTDSDLHFLALPAFEAEWVISLECGSTGTAEVIYRVAASNIWYANMVPLPSAGYRQTRGWSEAPVPVDIAVHRSALSSETCRALRDLWKAILIETSKREDSGSDGTSYVFLLDGISGPCGETWSPMDKSLLGRVVALIEDLRDMTLVDDPVQRHVLEGEVREQAKQLAEEQRRNNE